MDSRYQTQPIKGPIVVQGVPVREDQVTNVNVGSSSEVAWEKGEKQPNKCRDCPWAALFYIQLAVIIGLIISYTPQDLETGANGNVNSGIIKAVSQYCLIESIYFRKLYST